MPGWMQPGHQEIRSEWYAGAERAGSQPVVLRIAAFVPVVGRLGRRIRDFGDGLDVLEPELHGREQPERRPVRDRQGPALVMRREQRLRMARGPEVDRPGVR